MIKKSYEINKLDKDLNFFLFYGKNEGAKKEEILKITLANKDREISYYDEKQILDHIENFYNEVLSKSLFNDKKIIIINRVSDKFTKVVEDLIVKKIWDILIIINAEVLEKKSKLRSLFEKEKKLVCVPFYPDTQQILSQVAHNFLKEININLSQSNINLMVNRCNGDRGVLKDELKKIELLGSQGKKVTTEHILKLTNLIENHNISELVDNCLAKNKKKIISILNENNFNNEDCIIITRSFIVKAKKLLSLSIMFESNKNIDLTITSARPPIFWKEKEITKQQIYKWTPNKLRNLIYKLNEIELLIKKNINISINIVIDFILEQSSVNVSN